MIEFVLRTVSSSMVLFIHFFQDKEQNRRRIGIKKGKILFQDDIYINTDDERTIPGIISVRSINVSVGLQVEGMCQQRPCIQVQKQNIRVDNCFVCLPCLTYFDQATVLFLGDGNRPAVIFKVKQG